MSSEKAACTQRVYKVTRHDLPLSCPMAGMELWNAHPRVYLPIEATGEAQCGYCSSKYVLTDFSADLTLGNTTNVEYADASK